MNKIFTCITVMASAMTFLMPDVSAVTTPQIPTTPSINELNVDTENNDFYIVNTIKATDTQGNDLKSWVKLERRCAFCALLSHRIEILFLLLHWIS